MRRWIIAGEEAAAPQSRCKSEFVSPTARTTSEPDGQCPAATQGSRITDHFFVGISLASSAARAHESRTRRNKLHMLRDQGDLFLPFEKRMTRDYGGLRKDLQSRRARRHARGGSGKFDPNVAIADTLPADTVRDWSTAEGGDSAMRPPGQMEMSRGPLLQLEDGSHIELPPDAALLSAMDGKPSQPGLQRSWSVAY